MRTFLVILAALFVTVFADEQPKVIDIDKSDKFTHAEFNYPKGKYGSLNLVSHYEGEENAHIATDDFSDTCVCLGFEEMARVRGAALRQAHQDRREGHPAGHAAVH